MKIRTFELPPEDSFLKDYKASLRKRKKKNESTALSNVDNKKDEGKSKSKKK